MDTQNNQNTAIKFLIILLSSSEYYYSAEMGTNIPNIAPNSKRVPNVYVGIEKGMLTVTLMHVGIIIYLLIESSGCSRIKAANQAMTFIRLRFLGCN